MSKQERSPEKRDKPAPAPPRQQRRAATGHSGHSGHGADSALKQLREWEQRRASDRVAPDRDGPSRS